MSMTLAEALAAHPAENPQAMDVAHARLIAGLICAAKPERVLELGVGSAYLTKVLLAALAENKRGKLTSVDNFVDWKGNRPRHIAALAAENPEWELVEKDETEYLRAAQVGATLAFHDTNSPLFNILGWLPERCSQLGLPSAHFRAKSRPDENTDRGLLIVWKNCDMDFILDMSTSLYLRFRDKLPEGLKKWLRGCAGAKG